MILSKSRAARGGVDGSMPMPPATACCSAKAVTKDPLMGEEERDGLREMGRELPVRGEAAPLRATLPATDRSISHATRICAVQQRAVCLEWNKELKPARYCWLSAWHNEPK